MLLRRFAASFIFILVALATLPTNGVATTADTLVQFVDSTHVQSIDTIEVQAKQQDQISQPVLVEIPHQQLLPEWMFWVFLGQLGLIVFVRATFRREFAEVFTVFVNSTLVQQLFRETQAGGMRMSYFLMNVVFAISLGTWIYLAMKINSSGMSYADYILYPAIVITVIVLLSARSIALSLTAWLLRSPKELGLFEFTDWQLFRATGVLLYPFNAFLAYANSPLRYYVFALTLVILITFLLFRVLRGFEIGRTYFGQNFFHFLVYLCALEIAPVLIGIRYFLNSFEL